MKYQRVSVLFQSVTTRCSLHQPPPGRLTFELPCLGPTVQSEALQSGTTAVQGLVQVISPLRCEESQHVIATDLQSLCIHFAGYA